MAKPKIYEKICPICGKVFQYLNKDQLDWNYNVHYQSCKKKELKKNEI